MAQLSLRYRHNHRFEPHYISNEDVRIHAAKIRSQMNLGDRINVTLEDLKGIDRLQINDIEYDLWHDFDHQLYDDEGQKVLGVFEYYPESESEAVSICVSPVDSLSSGFLVLSTFAHELGHAIYDAPALISNNRTPDLPGLEIEVNGKRAFRSVIETPNHLGTTSSALPEHVRLAEFRANEFMGSLLVPENLLRDAVLDLAPQLAIEVREGDAELFAGTPDGRKKIFWNPVEYQLEMWQLTRAVAPKFGVSPAFIEVRLNRYGVAQETASAG